MIPTNETKGSSRAAWRLGQIAQGLVMGVLLFFVLLALVSAAGNVTIFQYQGF
jgi:hypothetical protein